MEQQLPIPISAKVSRESLDRVFRENPILRQTMEETLRGMKAETTAFVESVITPNARLMEKNIPDFSYSTSYGLDTVIIATQMRAASSGIRACIESGDLSKLADCMAAEITEAGIRAEMEKLGSTIRWMVKETKKMGKKKR